MREHILSLTKKDFIIDNYKASGPGGQKRNKTESAVRIRHEPSGAIATCCEERSQSTNKARAFKRLIDSSKFQVWLKMEIARVTGVIDQVTKEVDTSLSNPKNIKTEVHNEQGQWTEISEEKLDQ